MGIKGRIRCTELPKNPKMLAQHLTSHLRQFHPESGQSLFHATVRLHNDKLTFSLHISHPLNNGCLLGKIHFIGVLISDPSPGRDIRV